MRHLIALSLVLSLCVVGCEVPETEEIQEANLETLDELDGFFMHRAEDQYHLDTGRYVSCAGRTHAQCGGQQCSRTGTCQWKNNACRCTSVVDGSCHPDSYDSLSNPDGYCNEPEGL